MRSVPFLFVLLASAAPAQGEEGGTIRTGEHPGFSRIVMTITPDTEWTLDLVDGGAIIDFPGRAMAFTTDSVWERMGRERVNAITANQNPEGSEVRIDLACDCRATASFVDGRYLAIDVHDPAPSSPGRDPAADAAAVLTTAMEAARVLQARARDDAFAAAERGLVEQIERAARQGLIELTDQHEPRGSPGTDPESRENPVPEEPFSSTHEAAAPRPAPRAADAVPDLLAHLALDAQIAAVNVFDRDISDRRQPAPPADLRCQPDAILDIAHWSDGRPHADQAAQLRRLVVGEFDRPDAASVRALARLHIRHGFGAEARAVLAGFEAELPDRDLLADLGRIVDGAEPADPLARDIICPGRHGLWLAIAGDPAMLGSDAAVSGLASSFAELPRDLRMLLGPRLATNLLEAGHLEDARLILDVALRSGGAPTAALILASGRLALAAGQFTEAEAQLVPLVEQGGPHSGDALLALVGVRLAAGENVPEAWIIDLRALAFERAGGPRELAARVLAGEAAARNGNIRAALAGLASLAADSEAGQAAAVALAPRLLAEADIDGTGAADFAGAALEHPELIAPAPEHDAHRLTIAAKLLDLGFALPAIDMLGPAIGRGSKPARILAAQAHLVLGEVVAAKGLLDGIEGAEADALRARAAAYAGAGTTLAGAQAHISGEGKAEPMPEIARLPVPETASLGAARSLLKAGPRVRSLVDELLAAP